MNGEGAAGGSGAGGPGAPQDSAPAPGTAPGPPPAIPPRDALVAFLAPVLALMRTVWLPVLPGVAIGGIAIWLWQSSAEGEYDMVRAASRAQAGWTRADVEREILGRVRALDRLASATPSLDSTRWQDAADRLVTDGGFRGVALVDAEGAVRTVAPVGARMLSALHPDDDDARRRVLDATLADTPAGAGARVGGTVVLESGERQVVIVAPLEHAGAREGALLGVLRARDVLDAALRGTLRRGYTVSVQEGPELIHGPKWSTDFRGAEHAYDVDVATDRMAWTLRVWPDDDAKRRLGTPAPLATLAFGFLAAVLATGLTYLLANPAPSPSRPPAPPS